MPKSDEYYTVRGYERAERGNITATMEDYLEMIYRCSGDAKPVRVKQLSDALHVSPSAVTKIIGQLRECGYIENEKYGYITLTEEGRKLGAFLILRHETVHRFLCLVNHTDTELEETEKVEHGFSRRTVENLLVLLNRLRTD